MLVNITPIEVEDDATPELWNDRFAAITKSLNGNIEGDNLKARGVPREALALDAVGSNELAQESVLPSHMANTWVGKSSAIAGVDTSWVDVFNKTVSLAEASYLYVLWTASGNANKSGDPGVQILLNDVPVTSFSGSGGLELYASALNQDFPFALSGMGDTKLSGDVSVKVQVKHTQSDGWDVSAGFVRIDALSDSTNLDA